MPFGLKNASTTYRRAINAIFHDIIIHFMKIYIDDMVVKSDSNDQHLADIEKAFQKMRIHQLNVNSA